MSCHPFQDDLINQRASRETMSGIDGEVQKDKCVGDLPIQVKDGTGKSHRLLLRNIRCVPSFTETLISVDQLFTNSGAEARFGDHRCIYVANG
jgi:hypothetical protein